MMLAAGQGNSQMAGSAGAGNEKNIDQGAEKENLAGLEGESRQEG